MVTDQQVLKLGKIELTILHTPGHTMESICILIKYKGKDYAVFTGDTLFLGDAGRPDLVTTDDKSLNTEILSSYLFDSLEKLKWLSNSCYILPGHGAGSACGKKISSGNYCTMEK